MKSEIQEYPIISLCDIDYDGCGVIKFKCEICGNCVIAEAGDPRRFHKCPGNLTH
jgi:hypothetical protein